MNTNMRKNSANFRPLVTRDLVLVAPNGKESAVRVAVSEPYTPPATKFEGVNSACLVLTCDDPKLAFEVHGFDEWEALYAAMRAVDLYLVELVREKKSRLKYEDGTDFLVQGSGYEKHFESILEHERSRLGAEHLGSE